MAIAIQATVLYVEDVTAVLDFYRRAFALEPAFVDLDVQLPGRVPGGRYQFASLETGAAVALQFGTHDLAQLLMPSYRATTAGPSGVEVAFYSEDVASAYSRAVEAGAIPVAAPSVMPWGQTASYVRSIEGTYVAICSPLP